MEQLRLDDLTFLILLAIFGIGGFIGTCSVMWRYYDMEPILRRRAPKLTTFLVTIGRWLEKVLSKVGPQRRVIPIDRYRSRDTTAESFDIASKASWHFSYKLFVPLPEVGRSPPERRRSTVPA
jgi:hypothetical protein